MRELETLVIGGGISGLASAWHIAASGSSVEVWEAADHTGGKILTENNDGYITEQAASMVLNFRPEVSDFLQQSGLDSYKLLRTPTSKRYLINQGELQELPMKMGGMLASPLWSLRGKLRLALEPFILSRAAENESVADFIRRRLGNEMLDKALSAYISGTLASDPEQADARSVLPHLTALERRYGSLTAGVFARRIINKKRASITEGFSFRGGMSTLVGELSQQLGGNLKTGYKIVNIEPGANGWYVTAQTALGERNCHTQNLILSTPAMTAAKLLKPHNPELSELLNSVNYAPVSVVHLAYEKSDIIHQTDGTGFLTPWHEKLKLNGSMWMHSLFENRAPHGQSLLSNYLGGARFPQIARLPEQQKIELANRELKGLLGIRSDPVWSRVNHHSQALPLYHGQYTRHQQAIAAALASSPSLHLQANYLGGVSVRDRILCARELARQLANNCVLTPPLKPRFELQTGRN